MDRFRKSIEKKAVTGGDPVIKGKETSEEAVHYTPSATIMAWDPNKAPSKQLFSKHVELKIIGRTPFILTGQKGLTRYFLSNDENTFRLTVWVDAPPKLFDSLLLGHVVKIFNLQVRPFFKDDSDSGQTGLWRVGDFVANSSTTIKTVTEGTHEYPSPNLFPPYWRNLSDIKHGDKMIAIRVLLLGNAEKITGKLFNLAFDGVKFEIGDKHGKSACCFVKIDFNDVEEKTNADDFVGGAEFVIGFAETCKVGENLGLHVEAPEYIYEVRKKELTKLSKYTPVQYADFLATQVPVSKKKARRFL